MNYKKTMLVSAFFLICFIFSPYLWSAMTKRDVLFPESYGGTEIISATQLDDRVFTANDKFLSMFRELEPKLTPTTDSFHEPWLYKITFGNAYYLGDGGGFLDDAELIHVLVGENYLSVNEIVYLSEMEYYTAFLELLNTRFSNSSR